MMDALLKKGWAWLGHRLEATAAAPPITISKAAAFFCASLLLGFAAGIMPGHAASWDLEDAFYSAVVEDITNVMFYGSADEVPPPPIQEKYTLQMPSSFEEYLTAAPYQDLVPEFEQMLIHMDPKTITRDGQMLPESEHDRVRDGILEYLIDGPPNPILS